ncbi:MAG: DmsE family decaheme c-type cytochrome [Acidobacteria bacterium]|nr:DmsE family decaheme c-type cytochrome [Acidobacteriota bacterium]
MLKRYKTMLQNSWIWIAGLALALSASQATSAAKATKKPVEWEALNPAFNGATFVNNPETCRICHQDPMDTYDETMHAQALKHTVTNGGCESCHGPRSKHIENPTQELAFEKLTPAQQSAVCLQCHEGGNRFGWKAGAHRANDVICLSCHSVMEKKSERALLAKASAPETCFQCHGEVRAETNKTSHHPVREGRMDCASCHNPHGSTPGLLVKNTLNETCYTCHTEKRGPFLWEHAPVRENCANCHTAHGSNHRNLLASKDSFLCLSCHSYGGHVNLPRYNRVSNPYGSGCVNCHIATHGSNHPSGAKQTR